MLGSWRADLWRYRKLSKIAREGADTAKDDQVLGRISSSLQHTVFDNVDFFSFSRVTVMCCLMLVVRETAILSFLLNGCKSLVAG